MSPPRLLQCWLRASQGPQLHLEGNCGWKIRQDFAWQQNTRVLPKVLSPRDNQQAFWPLLSHFGEEERSLERLQARGASQEVGRGISGTAAVAWAVRRVELGTIGQRPALGQTQVPLETETLREAVQHSVQNAPVYHASLQGSHLEASSSQTLELVGSPAVFENLEGCSSS